MKTKIKKSRVRIRNQRMSQLRERFNLTQEQLGKEVGLTQSMISHIEAGRKDVGKEYKILIASFFNRKLRQVGENITVDWLFYEQVNDLKSLKDSFKQFSSTGTEG